MKYCNKCGNEFDSKNKRINCDACIDLNKSTCLICSKRYLPKEKYISKYPGKCDSCHNCYKIQCICCNEYYIEHKLNMDIYPARCGKCDIIHYKLINHDISKLKIVPNSKLCITWSITDDRHGGYCSDPDSGEELDYEETDNYSLLKELENINDEDIPNHTSFNYYIKKNIPHGGYCKYTGITYSVKSVNVIKN